MRARPTLLRSSRIKKKLPSGASRHPCHSSRRRQPPCSDCQQSKVSLLALYLSESKGKRTVPFCFAPPPFHPSTSSQVGTHVRRCPRLGLLLCGVDWWWWWCWCFSTGSGSRLLTNRSKERDVREAREPVQMRPLSVGGARPRSFDSGRRARRRWWCRQARAQTVIFLFLVITSSPSSSSSSS